MSGSILIVDDDKVLLRTLQALLEKTGYAVSLAEDGHAAFEKVQQEKFNLVITDINMPHQFNGFRLMKAIRDDERNSKTPIIALTGRSGQNDVIRAVQSGCDDYVVKPIDFDIFLAKVETLIGSKSGDKSFYVAPVKSLGSWTANFEITGVSEQGLVFISPAKLPVNFKFKMETPFFAEMGIESPLLRVAASHPFENSDKTFSIKTSFIGLAEGELQLIRRWIMKNSPNFNIKSS